MGLLWRCRDNYSPLPAVFFFLFDRFDEEPITDRSSLSAILIFFLCFRINCLSNRDSAAEKLILLVPTESRITFDNRMAPQRQARQYLEKTMTILLRYHTGVVADSESRSSIVGGERCCATIPLNDAFSRHAMDTKSQPVSASG